MTLNVIFAKINAVKGKLYLIPNLLGDGNPEEVLSPVVIKIIRDIRYFIVEDIRTARRFLSKVKIHHSIDSLTFFVLNEHTLPSEIGEYLHPINDNDIGVLSEAGVPGVADPGADIVSLAHSIGIQVVPLIGPSSILMAVMASGLNGQNFAFNGYLPVKHPERVNKIKFFEKRALSENQTQVFIEAPYRNMQLLEDIINTCSPTTMLGIGADICLESEFIKTQPIECWKKKMPELHKRPAIFLIGR
jgi:16S rRNA (cytidine1402-2'-O)-methyltransferase